MGTIQEGTEQPGNRKKLENLYHKSITLAKEAKKREDHILAESYYQRAEHYLHAMNEPGDSVHTNPRPRLPATRLSARKVLAIKKVIEGFNLKISHEKSLSKRPNAPIEKSDPHHQATILPFKTHLDEREIQHTQEIPE